MTNGSGIEGAGPEAGINEEGWLALHTFFVQKGRLETTWKALRCFGYGEDLMLREEFLHPRCERNLSLSLSLSLFSLSGSILCISETETDPGRDVL